MEKLLDKSFGPDVDKRSEIQIAFAMALVDTMLNPKKLDIKMKEEILQLKIVKYLVYMDFKYELVKL